jgi:hypothetical protein
MIVEVSQFRLVPGTDEHVFIDAADETNQASSASRRDS